METTTMNNVKFKADFVRSVYSGKNGKCCCGCAGKHRYASALREEASKDRGYEVKDDEVNDRQVAKVVAIMNDRSIPFEKDGLQSDYVAKVVGNRLYIAYFRNRG
jgi:hypothetical protein